MKRKIENFIFDCIIYLAAFGLITGYVTFAAWFDTLIF